MLRKNQREIAMASKRHKRRRKRNRGRLGAVFTLLCAVALVAAATVGATVFFQVETIEVVGNSRYTAEEVVAISEIQIGDNLFRMGTGQIASQIRQQLPYIGEVSIKRRLPSTLTIQVKEWTEAARVEVYQEERTEEASDQEQGEENTEPQVAAGQAWLISASGKLLEPAGEGVEAISVTGLTVLAPQAGSMMAVPKSQQQRLDTLKEVLHHLDALGLMGKVSAIDLTNSTFLELQYSGNFKAKLPVQGDMAHLLKVLNAAVEKTVQNLGEQSKGTMDLTQKQYDAVYTPEAG